ncbi:MAG TPA: LCP family protein [Methylomusa anaerophila]|uniref:Transcriptional regulator LytR n=1 Tax=Methylomusa anaerophila TaxID=1930071 RepID=A0A348AF85_9FIRM|nr:LCP family protein [Methylomusa anaerophila]BBB89733.1 transcriptional regulator LytR [Methylomusa anaerophila]HML89221.1 LCP family protein [Methylomusa anaerophila]
MRDMNLRARGRRRKIRWDRVFLVLVLFLLVIASLAGASIYVYTILTREPAARVAATAERPVQTLNNRVNILILGLDDLDRDNPGNTARRSDSMIIASFNPEDGTMNLLSLPRDTEVSIPGHKGLDKLNHAYAYGGPELARNTVEQFLRVPINYYVALDWEGFIKISDILGGVNLYVEHDMNYDDPYADLQIHLARGYQHLDGNKAGQYVRYRSDELGDIGRVQRQQRFLKAIVKESMQFGSIFKMPALASAAKQHIHTDMSFFTLFKLAINLANFKTDSVHAEMLPGNFATIDGSSYWILDKDQAKLIVEKMLLSTNTKMSGVYQNGSGGASIRKN